MSTVILGGGIIGTSIAYYLSANQPEGEIHIVEQSPELFSAASGYAAGFLARDWFVPSLAPLGALSFDLHKELAAGNDGQKNWGFMNGTAFNLDAVSRQRQGAPPGDDWLQTETSRAETAAGSDDPAPVEWPEWLTRRKEGMIERISQEGTVAQVDPLRLSRYLMDGAISRGAKLHHPAQAAALVKEADGTITGVSIVSRDSKKKSTIPCTTLVLSMGPWTPQVLKDLFPSSTISLDISPLAGYSLVVRSPRYTLEHQRNVHRGQSHAVFTTLPSSYGFSPEIFLREGGEIYIAGLNPTIKLPSRAEDINRHFDPREMQKLKDVAVRLLGGLAKDTEEAADETTNLDDLETLREGLCFRPVGSTGVPTIGKIENLSLGGGTRASPRGGVFIAAGHGPWGISLSLGTGKIISEMIKKQKTSVDVTGLAVTGKGSISPL
ncbi:hypothetical protein N7522_006783 [Penicillium canescens]|uniref:FAD dependent oxidoreductase domain-containing protein n=1 Tax=Penicillium canescens TaxID=5083 RepID=A0AAD6I8L6_PENCN|nr:uncharacterized protein N7446_010143 [Penicillium canescens]KAJ6001556.1 hypothetical protein N7522_006783 [Penicillium canescens]KAJ6035384.1 hypothetical protein N7460_009559 [Penicillium canescens]KAJ6037511.1 hypothetical protein N7444_010216 [Penicillium canescens]KAJ6054131.1 hypothetical protein N7446_010143 [Penicillium canescens]